MGKIQDVVNQNVKDVLKKLQDAKNKEHEKTQRQIKELRKDFNKHQSETRDTIKREIYELKKTTRNLKELNKDMENLRKKNQTEILETKSPFSQTKSTAETHSSKLELVEIRISELENKTKIKEKTKEEIFVT
jgi:hypothetical protein